MRIGISGHQELDDPSRWEGVRERLEVILSESPKPLVGISSLAIGADQLFAQLVLDAGGSLEVVLPFPEYAETFTSAEASSEYRRLLTRAGTVETLRRLGSDEESFFAAGKKVVEMADMMVTVWDGQPAEGLGGTADVVRYAKEVGKKVVQINPNEC